MKTKSTRVGLTYLLWLLCLTAAAQVAPAGFTLDVLSNSEIKISWTHDGKSIDKFVIEKSTDGNTYQILKTLGITERTYTEAGLKSSTTYYYRIYSGLGTRNSTIVSAKATTLSNPPTGFNVTAATPVRIDLSWNSGGTPTQLDFSKNSDFSGATTKKFTTEQSGFADGLTPNTSYYFRLKRTVYNGAQESDWVQVKASTQDAKPAAPAGFALTGKNTNSIGVKWNAVSGAEGYQVRRADAADFSKGVVTQDIALIQTSYTFSGLDDNHIYYMQVRAKNTISGTDYWSDWSGTLTAATDQAIPAAPSGVQATPKSPTQVDVGWTDNSDNEETFTVSRSTQGTGGPWTEAVRVAANTRTFTDNSVQPGQTYYYQVCAVNKTGQACAISSKITTPIQAPAAPTALNVSIRGTTATVTWKDNASNESEHEIQRKEDNGAFADYGKTGAFDGAGTFTDTKLSAGKTYCYRVRATNTGGASAYSNESCGSTQPSPPNAPTNLQLTLISAGQVDLAWTDGGGTIDFEVQRAEGSGSFTKINTLSAGKTTDQDKTIQQGKTYSYRINAINGGGSALSEVKTITIPATPSVPELTLQALSASAIKVDYRNTAGANATTLELQYSTDKNFATGVGGQNVPIAGSTVTIGSLQANTRYYFRLRASNPTVQLASDWVYKDVATLPPSVTIPNAPTNLNLFGNSDGRTLNVTWTDASDNETGFEIQYSENSDFSNTKSTTAGASISAAIIPLLEPCRTYFVRVRASNSAGSSAWLTGKLTLNPNVPGKAAGLVGTAASQTQINLVWTYTASTEEAFELEYADNSGYTGSTKRDLAKASRTENVTGLRAATKYWFRLRAKNCGGNGDWIESTATTQANTPQPPAAPTNLIATALSDSEIALTWTDNSDETGFDVERSPNGVTGWTYIRTTAANETTFRDNGLTALTRYVYRVEARRVDLTSPYSNTAAATTSAPPVVAPAAPVNLKATAASSSQINLSWNTASGLTGYKLEYADNPAFMNPKTETGLARTATSVAVQNLLANTPYYFRLYAINSAGTSPAATTDARTAAAPITKPNAPTNLNLSGSPDGRILNVTWTDASDNETRFDIQYAETADFANPGTATVGPNVGQVFLTSLQPCRTYYVRVSAANSAGSSAWIDGRITLNPNLPPKANLVAEPASQTRIVLQWATYQINTEDAFELEYADNSNYTNSTKRDLAKASRAIEDINGLKAATLYWFRLRAKNCAGAAEWSEATATTLAPPVVAPAAPTGLSIKATVATQLAVTWTDVATNEEAYELQYSTDATFATGAVQVRLGAGESATTLTGLVAGTTYFIRVRAVNSAGASVWLSGSGTTLPAIPSTLQSPTNLRFAVGAPVYNQLSLLWNDIATNETGYEVWRSANDQTNWVRVAEVAMNTAAYIDKGLRSGVAYFYRVRAVQNTTFSDWSNIITDHAPIVSAVSSPLPAETRVYPNPVSDWLTVDSPLTGSVTVQLQSLTGYVFLEQQITNLTGTLTIDMQSVPAGVYILVLSTVTARFSTRILKR